MLRAAIAFALALLVTVTASPAASAPRFRPLADDVFYMYLPIAWRDSDADPWRYGDFDGMAAAIPYLDSLGVTAVWMTPVFVSPAYHGYQHGPADSLNPWFGDEPAFWSFVQAAHAESIKVFIDFVVYGISQSTEWFQDSYANPGSVYDSWLAYTNAGNTSYLGCCPYPTWNGSTVGFIHWDLRHPAVTQKVTDWARHWIDPNGDGDPSDGVDGFRADHVSAYHPDESPWGYDLAWWQSWKAALQSVAPDVITFAEQADWSSYGYELLSAFDAAFTKPFESAARHGLAVSDGRPLAGTMETTLLLLPPDRVFLTTLGNHDVSRLATSLSDDPGRLRAAAAVLMLQPLPPVMYFGDEIGMRGSKRTDFVGDAQDIPFREPFKWNAVAGPPMSNYFAANAQAYDQRVSRDLDGRSVEEQSGVAGSLLEHYRALASLRHAHPGLRHGAYYTVASPDTALWAFLKVAPEETLLVAVHLGPGALEARLDLSSLGIEGGSSPVVDVETGAALVPLTPANQASYPLPLATHAHRVLRLSAAPFDLRRLYTDANLVVTQDSPSPAGIDHVFELDQMFVRSDLAGLALGITGNLIEGGYGLALFFDAVAGGQGTLQTQGLPEPPSGMPQLAGLTMEAGFVPEKVLFLNLYSGLLYADLFTLATGGGGSKRYLGSIAVGAQGALGGGENPNGLTVAYSATNRGGVTPTSAEAAASATDGFRILVPWADLGLPGPGPELAVMAMLVIPDGLVTNQILPGIQGATPVLGYPPVDLNSYPGRQYAFLGSTTTTAASLVSARIRAGAVEIVWRLAEREVGLEVERRTASTGWASLGAAAADGQGNVLVTDGSAAAGTRYGYRLIEAAAGRMLGEAWIDVPAAPGLVLRGIVTEPASGRMRVRFAAAGGAPLRIEALDVTGRRVAERRLGTLEPGDHEAAFGAGLPPGLYFVRITEGQATARGRAVLLR